MMHGLTLIEVLVYMTLLSFLLIGTHTMSTAITADAARIHAETQILSEGIFISKLLTEAVTNNAVVYAGTGSLSLSDGRVFRLVSDVLWYDYGSTSQQLTHSPVKLSMFESVLVSSTTAPTYVVVSFTLSVPGTERSFISLLYP